MHIGGEILYAYLSPVSSTNSLIDALGPNLCPTFSLGIEQHSPTQISYPGKKELCGDVCRPYIMIRYNPFSKWMYTTIASRRLGQGKSQLALANITTPGAF